MVRIATENGHAELRDRLRVAEEEEFFELVAQIYRKKSAKTIPSECDKSSKAAKLRCIDEGLTKDGYGWVIPTIVGGCLALLLWRFSIDFFSILGNGYRWLRQPPKR